MNLYKTYTLLQAIVSMPKTHTFLRDTFFPKNETFVTEEVLIDYKKGKRRMAPFVAPRVGGITIKRDGYKTERLKAPRLAPQRAMTIDDVSTRMVGENIFSNKTPAQRQNELLATDLQELGESIDRREEFMAAQVLFTGKVDLAGYADDKLTEKVDQELDYDFTQKETLSGDDLWSNSNSNPYNYLAAGRKQIIKESGVSPDVVIMGEKAAEVFVNHPKIKELFDKLNINLGLIQPTLKNEALTFIGKLPGLGLEIYTYDEYYEDEVGELQPMVPVNDILIAKTAQGAIAYGAITQLEDKRFNTYEGRLVPKQWADAANETIMLRLSSRPVPKPGDVNGWLVATVL
ncbi:major capsid protein [Lysinibacillus sp. NPDC047702]|uniref:major capsid protein n=1 Tax=unclassified Lysinibacillus TaxID=2636778 RepID=UPI003CFC98A5